MGSNTRGYNPSTGNDVLNINGEVKIEGSVLAYDVVSAVYDFDVHGGEVGDIPLGVTLPAGAIILDGIYDVLTAVTGETGATIALKAQNAGDLLAATAVGSAGTVGLHAITPDGTAAKAVKLTQNRELTLTVGTAALTAGKLKLYVRYVL